MYGHGIATIALCEAYGMTHDRAFLLKPATAAVGLIILVRHAGNIRRLVRRQES